jgi:uncharacterized protein involved in copper resistance
MTWKYFVLAISCCFLLTACEKSKEHDHASHDHEHAEHKHDHKGHDHAAHKHDTAVKTEKVEKPESAAKTVEAGCGMCIFKMEGVKKCELAVKIDGKPYLVEGSAMFDHGDAHAEGGMCKSARMAVVEGKIEGDKFKATKFELKPKAK